MTSFAELYALLDLKEQAFVDRYLRHLNAARAAREVWRHNKASRQQGYKVLHRSDVAATIAAGFRARENR